MDVAGARARGEADGRAAVELALAEHGSDAVILTLRPWHAAWDEAARAAGVAGLIGVPVELHEAYYEAYALAARRRVVDICVARKSTT